MFLLYFTKQYVPFKYTELVLYMQIAERNVYAFYMQKTFDLLFRKRAN